MSQQSFNPAILRLVVDGQVQTDSSFPLPANADTILGREADCDIVLEAYSAVSRRHAAIRLTLSDEWAIADLGSSNGTYVNGEQIQGERVLREGDRFQLAQGGPEFQFEYEVSFSSGQTSQSAIAQPRVIQETIEERNCRIEISPTKLVITQKNLFISRLSSVIVSGIVVTVFGAFVFPLLFLFFPFVLLILALTLAQDISYTFDLESDQLTVSRATLVGLILQRRRNQQYPLNEFVSVRLERSEFDNNTATYAIFLNRARGNPLRLALTWQQHWWRRRGAPNTEPRAEEIVEIIERFLTQS